MILSLFEKQTPLVVRWGIADKQINAFVAKEVTKRSHLTGVTFKKGKDEYLPIPEKVITLSAGNIKQNDGY